MNSPESATEGRPWAPRRVWSLWDMLEFHAAQFVAVCQGLQAARMAMLQNEVDKALEEPLPTTWPFSGIGRKLAESKKNLVAANHKRQEAIKDALKQSFRAEFLAELEYHGLIFSLAEARRLRDRIFSDADDVSTDDIEQLSSRIRDELASRVFIQMDYSLVKFYESDQPIFGAIVEAKFPTMSEDIAEAGNCIALERNTAAVFHLMRVMELALQRLGDELGVGVVTSKNWQNILDEVNKAIKARDHKDPKTKAYAEAAAHLYNVKLCWRNEVMHPKQTYSEDEARALFAAIETFIRDLAGVL